MTSMRRPRILFHVMMHRPYTSRSYLRYTPNTGVFMSTPACSRAVHVHRISPLKNEQILAQSASVRYALSRFSATISSCFSTSVPADWCPHLAAAGRVSLNLNCADTAVALMLVIVSHAPGTFQAAHTPLRAHPAIQSELGGESFDMHLLTADLSFSDFMSHELMTVELPTPQVILGAVPADRPVLRPVDEDEHTSIPQEILAPISRSDFEKWLQSEQAQNLSSPPKVGRQLLGTVESCAGCSGCSTCTAMGPFSPTSGFCQITPGAAKRYWG